MVIRLIAKENLMKNRTKVDYYYEIKKSKSKDHHVSEQMKAA